MFSTQQRGVKPAGGPPVNQGEPRTLAGVDDARLRIIHYYDDRGREVSEVVMEFRGEFFVPPNSVEWARALRPMPAWQKKLLEQWDAQHAEVELPDHDAVDVIPSLDTGTRR